MFNIIPAVDILNGKCVRLLRGEYNAVTEYSNDPLEMAERWAEIGAKWLHVVDLNGAKSGVPENLEIIREIIGSLKINVQVGDVKSKKLTDSMLDEADIIVTFNCYDKIPQKYRDKTENWDIGATSVSQIKEKFGLEYFRNIYLRNVRNQIHEKVELLIRGLREEPLQKRFSKKVAKT